MPKKAAAAEYEVEEVLDRRTEKGRVEYYVKWKDYTEWTWEPLAHLKNAMDKVQEYDAENPFTDAPASPSKSRGRKAKKGAAKKAVSPKKSSGGKKGRKPKVAAAASSDDVYVVESVLDRRGEGRSAQYYVKWEGYDEWTWEPLANLAGAKKMVSEFDAKLKSRSGGSAKKGRGRPSKGSPKKGGRPKAKKNAPVADIPKVVSTSTSRSGRVVKHRA